MTRRWDVLCVGAAVADIPLNPVSRAVFDHDSYPLDRIAMTVGGDAANEAVILARQGVRSAIAGLVGDDAPGAFIRAFLRKNGVDDAALRTDPAIDTSINIALVTEDGERTFVTNRNGSLWKLAPRHIDPALLKEARALSLASLFNSPLLDGPALETIFGEAKRQGLTVFADMIKPRLGETLADIRPALAHLDCLFANREEAALLTGADSPAGAAAVFLGCGVKTAVIKTGGSGCYVAGGGEAHALPAYSGVKMVDTVGAGDNFAAGFIKASLDGKNPLECAKYATAVASLSVEGVGASGGVRDLAQIEARYRDYLRQLEEKR